MYRGRLGERGLRVSDITWLNIYLLMNIYLFSSREIWPAVIYQEAGQQALLWKLKTKPARMEPCRGLPAALLTEQRFSPSAWVPEPCALTQGKSLQYSP